MKQKDCKILVEINVALYPRCSSVSVFPSAESRISYDARLLSKRVMQDI